MNNCSQTFNKAVKLLVELASLQVNDICFDSLSRVELDAVNRSIDVTCNFQLSSQSSLQNMMYCCLKITQISPVHINCQGSKNFFPPGSKLSTFFSSYTLSSLFHVYYPILSIFPSLLLSFSSLPFLPSFLSLLVPSLPFPSLLPPWEI